jgi:hypothetical protein
MDDAANDASIELEKTSEEHSDGVKAVQEWMKKWVPSAGYKRLGKILAVKWAYNIIATLAPVCSI